MGKSAKSRISLRKTPKQARSRSLTEAVLEATTRILSSAKPEGVTTNRIARLAGASIGSLYQYFPNKDAIFAGLIERHLKLHREETLRILKEHASEPTAKIMERIVDRIVDVFLDKKTFLKSLFVHLPRLERTRELLLARGDVIDGISDFLRTREDVSLTKDLRLSVMVTVHAIMGVIQMALLSDDPSFTPVVLKAELNQLVRSYLLSA